MRRGRNLTDSGVWSDASCEELFFTLLEVTPWNLLENIPFLCHSATIPFRASWVKLPHYVTHKSVLEYWNTTESPGIIESYLNERPGEALCSQGEDGFVRASVSQRRRVSWAELKGRWRSGVGEKWSLHSLWKEPQASSRDSHSSRSWCSPAQQPSSWKATAVLSFFFLSFKYSRSSFLCIYYLYPLPKSSKLLLFSLPSITSGPSPFPEINLPIIPWLAFTVMTVFSDGPGSLSFSVSDSFKQLLLTRASSGLF